MTDYEALKASGHSPAQAAEIVLDAKRGDRYALDWIKMSRAQAADAAEAKSSKQPHLGDALMTDLTPVRVEIGATYGADDEVVGHYANIIARDKRGAEVGIGGWNITLDGTATAYEGTENWGFGGAPDAILDAAGEAEPYSADWWDAVDPILSDLRRAARPMLTAALAA